MMKATEQKTGMQTYLSNSRAMQQRTCCAAVALALAALALTGCGIGGSAASSGPVSVTGLAISGKVHGGQSPVKTSTVNLYAAGTTGYGSAATLLASTSTDTSGNFNITAPYTCPSGGQIYITAIQGDSGSGNNLNLAMMAALGTCPVTSAIVNINEVTTVATVWALAPFMTGPTNIGSPSTPQALSGIAAAFADVNTLVNVPTGVTPGLSAPTNATVPTALIYTLANIIAPCINSAGGTAGQMNNCGSLFTQTTITTAPTDTITAAMNIAQHPGTNVTNIYGLAATAPPFQTGLSTQPSDFTMAVTFTGNMSAPSALAADASGNIWIANKTGNTVTELAQNGTLLSGSGYVNHLNAPSAVAFDSLNNLWITNSGNNTLSVISGNIPLAANLSPFSGGSMSSPTGIAFDSLGHGWVTNNVAAGTVTEFVPAIDLTPTFSTYTPSATAHFAVAVNPH
jgi:hypothetical protein